MRIIYNIFKHKTTLWLTFLLQFIIVFSCKERQHNVNGFNINDSTLQEKLYKSYTPFFAYTIYNEQSINQYLAHQKAGLQKNEIIVRLNDPKLEDLFFRNFKQHSSITYLELDYFKSSLSLIKLKQFTNLKNLTLRYSPIVNQNELFYEISKLKHLESLDLIDCSLNNYISPQISNLKSLKALSIENKSISKLPNEIGQLTNLELLYVHGKLKYLPDSIVNLKNLRELNLGYNSFSVFPQGILKLQNLVYLNLENNNISNIPVEIKRLKKLKFVSIANTGISKCIFDASVLQENINEIEYNKQIKISFRPYQSEFIPK